MAGVRRYPGPAGVAGTGGCPGARAWAEDRTQRAHDAVIFNYHLVKASSRCGCYHCLSIFPATAVDRWCDGRWIGGKTALCPVCRLDSVVPDASGLPIDRDFLEALQPTWCRSVIGTPNTQRGVWRSRSRSRGIEFNLAERVPVRQD